MQSPFENPSPPRTSLDEACTRYLSKLRDLVDRDLLNTRPRMSSLPQHKGGRSARVQGSKKRGVFIYLALLLGLSWTAYIVMNRSADPPSPLEGQVLADGNDGYGQNARPGFKDMIQLLDLPSNLLPETGKHRRSGRLIVVGDVHGMKAALVDLLAKVDFDKKHDHLILAGDMISKGPDSPGIVDLAMKLGATGVRGNHEDRIILAHADMVAEHAVMDGPHEDEESKQDALEEESFSHGDYKDRALVKALGEKRIKWLKACPVILRVGKLGSLGEVVVVHAGLAPGVALEKQDPLNVMNMRTIGKDGVPSDARDGQTWIKVCYLVQVVELLLMVRYRSGTNTRKVYPKKIARPSYTDTTQNAASRSKNTAWALIRDV